MKIVANASERTRVYRTVGILLVIVAPALALGTWYSTGQPLDVLAMAERSRATLPPDEYSSAVYHGSHAQATLDNKWKMTGFATLGSAGFILGLGLLTMARRGSRTESRPEATG